MLSIRESRSRPQQKLTAADNSFDNYQLNMDRAKVLISGGLTDVTNQAARNALANELEALRTGFISFANTRNGDNYLFGGTRQGEPPVDPITGVPSDDSSICTIHSNRTRNFRDWRSV